jgi:hypothetical protein
MKNNNIPVLFNNHIIDEQYRKCTTTLFESGIIYPLTMSDSLGVIGIDAKEYPVPTLG